MILHSFPFFLSLKSHWRMGIIIRYTNYWFYHVVRKGFRSIGSFLSSIFVFILPCIGMQVWIAFYHCFHFQTTNLKEWFCIPFHLFLSLKPPWRMGIVRYTNYWFYRVIRKGFWFIGSFLPSIFVFILPCIGM